MTGPVRVPSATVGGVELAWRSLTTTDAPALLELIRASEVADDSPFRSSHEEVAQQLTDPELELSTDSLAGVLPDARLACFVVVRMRSMVTRRRAVSLDGTVHPELRRRGLGTAILGWSEERGRQLLDGHGDGLPRFLEAWSDERLEGRRALFSSFGYRVIRYYQDMRRPLDETIPGAPLDRGLTLERWDDARDDAVRRAHNEAFTDHWGSEPLSPETWRHRFSGHPHFRPDLTWIGLDGDQVVGYVMSYHSPKDAEATGRLEGWLGAIGVRRPWRRQGVASTLICHVMREMKTAGLEYAALDVDSENPTGAAGLYGRLGFVATHRQLRWAKAA